MRNKGSILEGVRRIFIIHGLLALFCGLLFGAMAPRSVDEVLNAYVEAVGGIAAVDSIQTRRIRASTGLIDKQELFWQKPDKVLLLADKEKTGFDGSAGWVLTKRKKVRRLSQGQQIPLEIDANPLRYVNLKKLYSAINAAPQATIDGTRMDVLVAPNDLGQTTFYFNAQTHLLVRLEEKGDSSAYFTQVVWFEDYRPSAGVLFPFHITHKTSDKSASAEDLHIKSVENNVQLDASIFNKPQSANLVFGGKR